MEIILVKISARRKKLKYFPPIYAIITPKKITKQTNFKRE